MRNIRFSTFINKKKVAYKLNLNPNQGYIVRLEVKENTWNWEKQQITDK
jgi:hypothetical protein